jgi:Ca-activated chloride channel homolog
VTESQNLAEARESLRMREDSSAKFIRSITSDGQAQGDGEHAITSTIREWLGRVFKHRISYCITARREGPVSKKGNAKLLILISTVLITCFGALRMSPSQQQQPQTTVRITSDLVVVSVSVRDGAGNLVSELRREQFRLLDNGVEQEIKVFTEESLPLSLVILVDNDVNGNAGMQLVQSLRALTGGMSLQDEAAVCRFDMLFYPGSGFTSNIDNLMAELKSTQAKIKPTPTYVPEPVVCGNSTTGSPCIPAPTYLGSRPSKALDDAVYSAANLLESAGSDRRKIILVISDGVNEPKLNKHDFESVREKLLFDNVSVFSLAVGSNTAKRKYSRLENYSRISGGDIYYASKSRTMEEFYARITEQARHEYTLAYVPAGTELDSNYHRIELQVLANRLTAQTREGYYKNRPAATPKE